MSENHLASAVRLPTLFVPAIRRCGALSLSLEHNATQSYPLTRNDLLLDMSPAFRLRRFRTARDQIKAQGPEHGTCWDITTT